MRTPRQSKSLAEVNASVETGNKKGFWKTLLAFMGPAYMVSVGYMDPGNWATDIAGGSQFGFTLIWVLLMSNLMALLLQSLSARLGIVQKMDLAQASRANYPPFVNFCLWILAEVAIAACDLAEIVGMAIGLQLLTGLPLLWGVSLTVADTLLFLVLQNFGIRKMEAFIIALIAVIGGAFVVEMFLAKPDGGELLAGFVPSIPNDTALYIAIGIIGATVMPHNLYLHSSLVQTRRIDPSPKGIWQAIKFNFIDSAVALNLALFVNAAILILAASTFFRHGMYEVAEIQDAHKFLSPLLGSNLAPILFAVALIAAGQSSTITGTLAGQIIMEGYLHLRIQPWLRRLITRLIAIVPAFLVIAIAGESKTGDLLVFSQVILSLQLGFAIIPLIHFVSDKKKMGEYVIKTPVKIAAWVIAGIIVALNVKLVIGQLGDWMEAAGSHAWILWLTAVPLIAGAFGLLIYLVVSPWFKTKDATAKTSPHGSFLPLEFADGPAYKRIAVTIDFSDMDPKAIQSAITTGGKQAQYLLVHVVESAGAWTMGSDVDDSETDTDYHDLEQYALQMRAKGYQVEIKLGYGNPKRQIPKLVTEFEADLIVMGAHGHQLIKDILLGTTVDSVRHRLAITMVVVRA